MFFALDQWDPRSLKNGRANRKQDHLTLPIARRLGPALSPASGGEGIQKDKETLMTDETPNDGVRAAWAERAQEIIDSENVFEAAVQAMARRGFAGDARQVELLYAIFTSRLLARPMCAFLKAPSSAGKSW